MIFNRINIKNELLKEKEQAASDALLNSARKLLNEETEKEAAIKNTLHHYTADEPVLPILIDIKGEDQKHLFSTEEIKAVCVKYRLRFLDSQLFKNEIPYEALVKVKEFEKKNNCKLSAFKILAPKEAFALSDRNKDPLLFAEVFPNKYYLIHQWGNDLAWYKGILAYPLRNFFTFFHSILVLALLLALIIPPGFLVRNEALYKDILYYRVYFFAWSSIAMFFTCIYLGFSFYKNFSETDWNNKHFN